MPGQQLKEYGSWTPCLAGLRLGLFNKRAWRGTSFPYEKEDDRHAHHHTNPSTMVSLVVVLQLVSADRREVRPQG